MRNLFTERQRIIRDYRSSIRNITKTCTSWPLNKPEMLPHLELEKSLKTINILFNRIEIAGIFRKV